MTLDPQPHTRLDARHNDRGASLDPAPMSCGARWFCCWSLPSREFMAYGELRAKGVNAYLPLHLERRAARERIVSLFGSYLFVRFNAAIEPWHPIVKTRGIGGLICADGGMPTALPVGVVEDLQARTSDRRIVDDPGECPGASRIRAGAAGTVLQGPWAGWTGICTLSRRDRLTLLLALFGRMTPVELRHDQVIAA